MRVLSELFEGNARWAQRMENSNPGFFARLAAQQRPRYLWIGCSDSRVPANQIVDLPPGKIFVHRNVANVVVHSDLNCLSVLEFAVEGLGVEHVIVCGHYGCGGVQAALAGTALPIVGNWLSHVADVHRKYQERFAGLGAEQTLDLLCELNVREQMANVCNTTVARRAWERGSPLSVHGWIYRLEDGRLRDLGLCVTGPVDLAADGGHRGGG
jgi:carbonic anhydrase